MDFHPILFLMGIKIVALFIFVVLLTLTGIGVWNIYAGQVKMDESVRGTSIITNEKNSKDLHELLTQHTSLLSTHLDSLYDDKDIEITRDQLAYNTEKIGTVVGNIGTQKDHDELIKIFNSQTKSYEDYTLGAKEKNEDKMNEGKQTLEKDASSFGKLINKLSPSIQDKRGEELMLEHTAIILAIVDAHAQNDSGKKMLLLKDANMHANLFADEWAKSIEIEGDL